MTRDEVIWSLERCTCGVPDACRDCKVYDMREAADGDCIVCMEQLMRDALALLKDGDMVRVVRCAECEHWEPNPNNAEEATTAADAETTGGRARTSIPMAHGSARMA